MFTRNPRSLLLIVVVAVAGCGVMDATAPHAIAPTEKRLDGDSIPDPTCRSGYSTPQGRCTGDA